MLFKTVLINKCGDTGTSDCKNNGINNIIFAGVYHLIF